MKAFFLACIGICHHQRATFPQRIRGADIVTQSCLDCGCQLEYDWNRMKSKPVAQ